MTPPRHILYAEDDETLAFLTKESLQQHGYTVDHYANGSDCIQAFEKGRYDLCILDILLPGADGFAIAEAIRRQDYEIPILFLSAKTLKEDRLRGLRTGADDYLIKPFSIEELVLKMEVFLARQKKVSAAPVTSYRAGSAVFIPADFSLQQGNKQTTLTQKEAELLRYFLEHPRQVLKRDQILTAIWGQDDYFFGRSLDVFISRLRKLFADDPAVKIETLHGRGFRWVDSSSV